MVVLIPFCGSEVTQRVEMLVVRGDACYDSLAPLLVGEIAANVTVVAAVAVVVRLTICVEIDNTQAVAVGGVIRIKDADGHAGIEGDDASIDCWPCALIVRTVGALVMDLAHDALAARLGGDTPRELVGQRTFGVVTQVFVESHGYIAFL